MNFSEAYILLKQFIRNNLKKVISVGFILFIFPVIISIIYRNHASISNIGQFLSGTIGILFSMFAFIGLIVTLIIQIQQIKIQQTEITNNNINNQLQSFENNFFQLLQLYLELVSNFNYHLGKESYLKKEFLDFVYKQFKERFYDYSSQIAQHQNSQDENYKLNNTPTYEYQQIITSKSIQSKVVLYEYYENEFQEFLSPYVKTVYHLLKFIKDKKQYFDDGKISSQHINFKYYSNIFRAQLTNSELQLLLYCAYSSKSSTKLLQLLLEFDIFEHLRLENLIDPEDKNYLYLDIKEEIYNTKYAKTKEIVVNYYDTQF